MAPKTNINRNIALGFIDLFNADAFKAKFSLNKIPMKDLATWLVESREPEAIALVECMSSKTTRRSAKGGSSSMDIVSTLRDDTNAVIVEFGTHAVRQLLNLAVAVTVHSNKDTRVRWMFRSLFKEMNMPLSFINAGSVLQSVLSVSKKRKRNDTRVVFPPYCTLLFLHALRVLDKAILEKKVTATRNYSTGNQVGVVVKAVYDAFNALTGAAKLGAVGVALAPYIFYVPEKGLFRALSTKTDGWSPSSQLRAFTAADKPVFRQSDVAEAAWSRGDEADEALRYVAQLLLDSIHTLVKTSAIFALKADKLSTVDLFRALDVTGDGLPPIFARMPRQHATALGITLPPETVIVDISSGREHSVTSHTKLRAGVETGEDQLGSVDVVVKQEDVELISSSDLERDLSDEANAAFKTLEKGLKRYGAVHTAHFNDVITIHEEMEGKDLRRSVDLILTDPPYNIRREAQANNSSHDVLSDSDMDKFALLCKKLLMRGGQGHIFCSQQQFAEWQVRLENVKNHDHRHRGSDESSSSESSSSDASESDEDQVRPVSRKSTRLPKPSFEVERIPLQYVRAPGAYNRNPLKRKLTHTSVTEAAIHFWKSGATGAQLLSRVDYLCSRDTPSHLPGFTNVMDNIPRLPIHEVVYGERRSERNRRLMLRPEQKNVGWMKDLVAKFSRRGMLVVDPFAGTLAVAKACLMLDEHRKFVVSDVDEKCIRTALPSLVECFAAQILNTDSDIVGTGAEKEAAKLYLKAVSTRELAIDTAANEGPGGFPSIQRLPPYILDFVANFHNAFDLIDSNLATVPPSAWPMHFQSMFYAMDVEVMLALECSHHGVQRRPSLIKHDSAGWGLFAARDFDVGERVGFYYGTLVYVDMGTASYKNKSVGKGFMRVDQKTFSTLALDITGGEGVDVDGKNTKMFIVPGPHCATRFINDPRVLSGENRDTTQPTRVANCKFDQKSDILSASSVSHYGLLDVRTTKKVRKGAEFYIPYGNTFSFLQ